MHIPSIGFLIRKQIHHHWIPLPGQSQRFSDLLTQLIQFTHQRGIVRDLKIALDYKMRRGHRVSYRTLHSERFLWSGAASDNRTDTDDWKSNQYAGTVRELSSLLVEFR